LSRALYERGQTVLLVEEAHIVAPQGQTPRYAQVLVTDARTNANDLIMVTQRVQNLDTTMASQATIRVAFKMTDRTTETHLDILQEPCARGVPDRGRIHRSDASISGALLGREDGLELPIHTSKNRDFEHFG
jgi:hypothetical protein